MEFLILFSQLVAGFVLFRLGRNQEQKAAARRPTSRTQEES